MANSTSISKAVPPKARAAIFISIVLMIIIVAFGLIVFNKKSNPVEVPTGADVNTAAPVATKNAEEVIAGLPTDSPIVQTYKNDELNRKDMAKQSGGSFISSIESLNNEALKALEDEKKQPPVVDNGPPVYNPANPTRQPTQSTQQPVQPASYGGVPYSLTEDELKRFESIKGAMGLVVQQQTAMRDILMVEAREIDKQDDKKSSGTGGSGVGSSGDTAQSQYNPDLPTINAGTLSYAILGPGINTDEPGPVWADIVSGPAKGARVLGSFTTNPESATITFDVMSINGYDVDIQAYAVDPDTERTGIQDAVNHHYLERYGMLIAAAFVQGYAESMTDTTTVVQPDGTSTTTRQALPDAGDQLMAGVGKAGEKLVPIMEKRFDRPNTITTKKGRPIGILFMRGINVLSN